MLGAKQGGVSADASGTGHVVVGLALCRPSCNGFQKGILLYPTSFFCFVLFFKATRPRDIFSTYFFKNFLNFIFDCWVFVPVHRLSLVILSRGCSLVSLHRLLSVVSSFVEHRL